MPIIVVEDRTDMGVNEERIRFQEIEIRYLREGLEWQNKLIAFLAGGRSREELWEEWELCIDGVLSVRVEDGE